MWHGCAGDTLLHEAVNMSSRVGLVKPNDHIVVVQMISDSLVVKASPSCSVPPSVQCMSIALAPRFETLLY